MDHVELMGVRFDGCGRPGDLELPAGDPSRGAAISLMNEAALLALAGRELARSSGVTTPVYQLIPSTTARETIIAPAANEPVVAGVATDDISTTATLDGVIAS